MEQISVPEAVVAYETCAKCACKANISTLTRSGSERDTTVYSAACTKCEWSEEYPEILLREEYRQD